VPFAKWHSAVSAV